MVTCGSVELPKTTHLPKTTENHLENHIYKGIIPSQYLYFSSLCSYLIGWIEKIKMKPSYTDFDRVKCIASTENQKQSPKNQSE